MLKLGAGLRVARSDSQFDELTKLLPAHRILSYLEAV
jgi:hypothetical protein